MRYSRALATMALWFVAGSAYALGGVLFLVASVAFRVRDRRLQRVPTRLAAPEDRDVASARGWATGLDDSRARRSAHHTRPSATDGRAGAVGEPDRRRAAPRRGYLVVERRTRTVARDGFFSFEGRRYGVPGARPRERVELVLAEQELEIYSTQDGRRLARHQRGRPARALPDPTENSMPLARVLDALPDPEDRRPLSVYQDAING